MTSPPGVWTLQLPLTRPLSLNDRDNRFVKARRVRELRTAVMLLAKQAGIPPCARVGAELHYAPRDDRHRDRDNLVATLKPIHDGLVDAGVVPDDTPDFVESPWPEIDPPTGGVCGRLYVIVRELPPATAAAQ